jgi:superfamily I DNA and/or RNA helicase
MAGDPAQLPPTVTSREAQQEHQLTLTLFERLQNTLELETMLLDTQYRMNPAISAFPRYIPFCLTVHVCLAVSLCFLVPSFT